MVLPHIPRDPVKHYEKGEEHDLLQATRLAEGTKKILLEALDAHVEDSAWGSLCVVVEVDDLDTDLRSTCSCYLKIGGILA